MPLGGGRATPVPLPFLDSGHVLQPRRLLSLLTQKCFISLPDPPGEGQSCVQLRFLLCGGGGTGRKSKFRAGSVAPQKSRAQVSSLGAVVHPTPPPPKIRQMPLCLTCCGL